MTVSDKGESWTRLSRDISVPSEGITRTKMADTTVGSDRSSYTQMCTTRSDGSTRMGTVAIGRGDVFNDSLDKRRKSNAFEDIRW